jgi:hypothetical protein
LARSSYSEKHKMPQLFRYNENGGPFTETSQDSFYGLPGTTFASSVTVQALGPVYTFSNNNPVLMFADAAREGFVYDPAAAGVLFQDTAGATPASTIGQPVGRINDLSGRNAHALQATAAARPAYARVPVGGRRNILTATDNFALWSIQGTPDVTADGTLGGEPAFRLTDNETALFEGISRAPSQSVAGLNTLSVRIKKEVSSTSSAAARLTINDGIPTPNLNAGFIINPITGADNTGTAWDYGGRTVAVTDQGTHWLVTMTFTLTFGHTVTNLQLFPGHYSLDTTGSNQTVVGSNTWAAPQLEVGGVATAYQRVTTDADITEVGKANRFALLDDLVDDTLAVTLPAGTYTIATGDDAGVTILTGQVLSAGAYTIPGPRRLYAGVAINRALNGTETAALTAWLNARRP